MPIVERGKIGPDSDGVTYVGVGISCIYNIICNETTATRLGSYGLI